MSVGVEAIDQWLALLRKALSRTYDRLDTVLTEMEPHSARSRK